VLEDGVAVCEAVAVAVDCKAGDDDTVGVTTAFGAQAVNSKMKISTSFLTKTIIAGEFFEIEKLM